MSFSPAIRDFIDNLCGLPGIGSRTAQRIALYLLSNQRNLGHKISDSLKVALEQVKECERCRNFSEAELCEICQDDQRTKQLCIVESSLDVWAVEQSGSYKGYYFVLHGHISPIDDMGPEQLGLDKLRDLVKQTGFEEIVLATNPTVEGEITAHYIQKQLQPLDAKLSRIAHGVPMGGELEYIDGGTLARAFVGRTNYIDTPE